MKSIIISLILLLSISVYSQDNNEKKLYDKISFSTEFRTQLNIVDGGITLANIDANYQLNPRNSIGIGTGFGFKPYLIYYSYDKTYDSFTNITKYKQGISEANYYTIPLYIRYFYNSYESEKHLFGFDLRLICLFNHYELRDESIMKLNDFFINGTRKQGIINIESSFVWGIKICNSQALTLSFGFGFGTHYLVQPYDENNKKWTFEGEDNFKFKYTKLSIGYMF